MVSGAFRRASAAFPVATTSSTTSETVQGNLVVHHIEKCFIPDTGIEIRLSYEAIPPDDETAQLDEQVQIWKRVLEQQGFTVE